MLPVEDSEPERPELPVSHAGIVDAARTRLDRDTRDTEKELDKVTRPVTIWARSVETKATSYGNA